MKKSGNYSSFALFGLLANLVYWASLRVFYPEQINLSPTVSSFIISALSFVALRILMDWRLNDNPFEDYLREVFISENATDQLVFAIIGASFLIIANPNFIFELGGKVLWFGMLTTLLTQQCYWVLREQYNLRLLKKTTKTIEGVNSECNQTS